MQDNNNNKKKTSVLLAIVQVKQKIQCGLSYFPLFDLEEELVWKQFRPLLIFCFGFYQSLITNLCTMLYVFKPSLFHYFTQLLSCSICQTTRRLHSGLEECSINKATCKSNLLPSLDRREKGEKQCSVAFLYSIFSVFRICKMRCF